MNTRFASAQRQYLCIVILALAALARPERADALTPTPEEIDAARRFTAEKLLSAEAANLPFSFVYAGKPSGQLLKTWQRNAKSEDLDANRHRTTVEYLDPKSGLQVRCEAIEYRDFPTVEWTLYFKNTRRRRHADPREGPVARYGVAALGRPRVPAAPCRRLAGEPVGLRPAGNPAGAPGLEADRRRRRPPDQQRLVLLQPPGGRAGHDHRRRLAGPVGRRVRPRRRPRHPRPRRTGAGPYEAAPGRRDPQPADGVAVLARRPQPLAEPLAAVDDGPQHAQAGRQAAAAAVRGLQLAGLRRDDRRQRAEPDHAHRPLPGGRAQARLLVDGRRLVHPAAGLAAGGHVGGRSAAVPPRLPPHQRPRRTRRGSRSSSGSSRSASRPARGSTAPPGVALARVAGQGASAGRLARLGLRQ